MKKLILSLSALFLILLFPTSVYADSPVTSTEFSKAYEDMSIVKTASELGNVNSTIAKYLSNSSNSIDVKAAVINALSWNADGKSNADAYCKLIYKKSLANMDISKLKADQQFCIGYMMAMDDYFNTTKALKYLKLAEKNMPDSFTVAIIRSLVETMKMDGNEWTTVETVLKNSSLKRDMRDDAVNIILDYMALYNNKNDLAVSQNYAMIASGDSQLIYLYGSFTPEDDAPFQIVTGSDYAYCSIFKDQYGVFYLKITGVIEGSSSVKIKNQSGKSITINFDVVSPEAYSMIDNSIAMYIGKSNAYVNQLKTKISSNMVPYLKDGEQFVSIDFLCKAVGGNVTYNSKSGTSKFIFGNKTIIFTNGSKKVSINGKTSALTSKIVLKSKKQYITAKDFAKLTNKNYIYDNGLILLTSKNVKLDCDTDDIILEEIEYMVSGKDLIKSMILFKQNNKYGYDDAKGNVAVEPIYDIAYDFYNEIATVGFVDAQGNKRYGAIDETGKYVVQPICEWVGDCTEGLIPVLLDGKAGFVDKKGDIKISFQYSSIGCFVNGLAPVLNAEGTKWGYIDRNGNLVIPYTYTDCTLFEQGLAAVQIDNKWGYIDKTGKMVIEPIYDKAYEFYNGVADVAINGEYYLINRLGLYVVFYDNGDSYVGELKNGLLHGKGVYTYASGLQYTGDFVEGYFFGKGELTFTDGDRYSGEFKNDEFSGYGTYTWADGSTYVGEFENDNFNGKGILTDVDGTIQDGYWKDDQFLGETQ